MIKSSFADYKLSTLPPIAYLTPKYLSCKLSNELTVQLEDEILMKLK